MVLFFAKSPNDVIFVELEFVVLQGSSLIHIVVVQFPFWHIVVVLFWNSVLEKETIGLKDKTQIVETTQIE
ncbi:MAG TPA: hypothetical protein VE594_02640 [Nitrososphaeraceae archaeon]|jgi:hypothetical protein|nr:hypothetical protein [Nitrososphaeraceae archaeon]